MNRLKILGFSAMFGIFLLSSSPARADEATHILTDATVLTEQEHDGLMYVAIGAGAVAGIAVLNILTGGMALVGGAFYLKVRMTREDLAQIRRRLQERVSNE